MSLTHLVPLALAALPQSGDRGAVARGEELLVDLHCLACHAAPEGSQLEARLTVLPAPRLEDLGRRVRRDWIAEHLSDPGPRMPDLLGGLEEDERQRTARELEHFLASLAGPFMTTPPPVDPATLEQGRQLYHRVGCVACHAPLEVPEDLDLPLWSFAGGLVEGAGFEPELLRSSLEHLPRKTGHEALAGFLLDPLATRPAGEMPSLNLTPAEARALAIYLTTPEVRPDGPGFDLAPGLVAEYFEADPPDRFEGLPTRVEVVDSLALPPHREDHFGFRFRGFLTVPESGLWRFSTRSDDGSRLYVDGELVVDNWGDHAPLERGGEINLRAGRHALEVVMYERGGGQELEVTWAGPGLPRGALPPSSLRRWVRAEEARDVREAEAHIEYVYEGSERFRELRCDACHGMPREIPPSDPAKPLAELDPGAAAGCLGPEPAPGVPRYAFEDGDRAALIRTLERLDDLDRPRAQAEALQATLRRLDCYACHQRDGLGGPTAARSGYFDVVGDLDLGNEGRLPPRLDHIGWKLLPDALEGVLVRGESVRPYMHTRMPSFGAANVGHLTELLTSLDLEGREAVEASYREADIELGRRLAGTSGLGCIQCHNLAGHQSIGIPAVDLALVRDRLRVDWFRRLVLDPESIGMNSRMPRFFGADGRSPVRDILDGDPARQAEALWTWLSLGTAVPLPEGLVIERGTYELTPVERVITAGVFFAGASARVTLVGFPERVHAAFDVENSRLDRRPGAGVSSTRAGTWHGARGPVGAGHPTEDVLRAAARACDLRARWTSASDSPWPAALGRSAGEALRTCASRRRRAGRPSVLRVPGTATWATWSWSEQVLHGAAGRRGLGSCRAASACAPRPGRRTGRSG